MSDEQTKRIHDLAVESAMKLVVSLAAEIDELELPQEARSSLVLQGLADAQATINEAKGAIGLALEELRKQAVDSDTVKVDDLADIVMRATKHITDKLT